MARLAALSVAALATLAALPAAAQSYGIRFQNTSGATVYSIESSPTHDASWGGDLLGSHTLGSGQYLDVTIHNVSNCYYDLRVVFTDGSGFTDTFDLCAYSQYNIN